MENDKYVSLDNGPNKTLQILNVVGFVACMVFNGLASSLNKSSLKQISGQWDLRLQPAGYAFAIWGIIYLLMMIFTVYQALPSTWVPSRNDQLIFGSIGYVFFVNMLLNSFWLYIFQANSRVGFIVGCIEIWILLASCVVLMTRTAKAESLNWTEYISMNVGFSIYAGWVTSASILNIWFVLKTSGVQEP